MSRILIVLLLVTLVGYADPIAPPRGLAALAGGPGIAQVGSSEVTDACPGAQPIADTRNRAPGGEVTVQGSVTVPTGVFAPNQSFALQDATGGIYVYGKGVAGKTLDPGDRVCVTGRLALYHGLLEISPGNVTRLSRGDPPLPVTIDPAQVGEATEGLLISITGPASEVGKNPFRVGGAPVYLDRDTGATAGGLVEGCPVTVVGLSSDYDGAQVWPRSQEDIIALKCDAKPCSDFAIAQIQGQGAASPYDG